MPGHGDEVGRSVVVQIDELGPELDPGELAGRDSGGVGPVVEERPLYVPIDGARLAAEVCDEEVRKAIAVDVTDGNPHSRPRDLLVARSGAGLDGHVLERSVAASP